MFKDYLYLALGFFLVIFSFAIVFGLLTAQAGILAQGFFSEVSPGGVLLTMVLAMVAGFYFLKIGFVSMKSFFR